MGTSSQDTEITLGTGRMLALFFTFVLVCAVFFAIGFSLGRRTSVLGVTSGLSASSATVTRPAGKDDNAKGISQSSDSGGSKAGSGADSTAAADSKSQAASAPTADRPSTPPVTTNSSPATGGYFVQVAAVSRQEDAEALVDALKKKQYPAFAANNSLTDKYFHVQVGPYPDFKEADAMKTRLIADGYNPIVKK